MSELTSKGKDIDREEPVNARAQIYRRLMDAQEQIAHVLYRHDVSHDEVLAALDSMDEKISDEERREDLFLSGLEHYVAALGGRLEVRAVFGDDEILVRSAPRKNS